MRSTRVFRDVGEAAESTAAPEVNGTLEDNLTVRELYDHYVPIIKNLVLSDEAYQNACKNSDRDNAYLEGGEAVRRAALTIGVEDTVFLRLYSDNTDFYNRLHQEIVDETYHMLSQPQQNPDVEVPVSTERFEIARLWGGNAPFGIWDNEAAAFCQRDDFTLQFVDRDNAENFVENIQPVGKELIFPEPSAASRTAAPSPAWTRRWRPWRCPSGRKPASTWNTWPA